MLYAIKFFYNWLLPPGLFIAALLVLGVVSYKRNKKISAVILVIAGITYLLSISPCGDYLIQSLETRFVPSQTLNDRDVIIMLGYGATQDTPDVSGNGQLSGNSANRLLTTARLHLKTGLPIIISGGQVFADSGNEAQISRRILMDLGIPASKIFIDDRSRTTIENAMYTKAILEEQRFERPILVVSGFHLPRAVKNFERIGINVLPYPTDYQVSKNSYFSFNKLAPSYDALWKSGTALREYMGMLALKFW